MRKRRGITFRWLINTLGIITLILVVVNILFDVSIKRYLYNSVKQTLVLSASSNYHIIQLTSEDMTKNMNQELRSMVEGYGDKEEIELMSLDFSGNVNYTSSGFEADGLENPPDYTQALSSPDGVGFYIGKLPDGEKIMAYTQIISVPNNEFSAFRYVASLEDVDKLILKMAFACLLISAIILILVFISGSFFLNSIVRPIGEISLAVSRMASGDLSVRIKRLTNDELGELCEKINCMADELSASEQLKNEFISSVSHELRTPLTAIQGWSETILSVGADDSNTVKKGMRVITNETERLANMVEELLDFSRIQSGRFKLVKDRMDVLAELEEAVLIYTERARQDGKELSYQDLGLFPIVFGDKNRIRQVFINIIDNALKYTDPGDRVAVSSAVTENDVEITVEDTGCGISEKDLQHITDKFFKANNTRRGSGIGLAVAKEIIEMHDGKLIIESAEGEGTTVKITLPRLLEEQNSE